MFPSTYNPQSGGSTGISLQGSSPLQVIQGSSPNLQPAITANQLNTASIAPAASKPSQPSAKSVSTPSGPSASQVAAAAAAAAQAAQVAKYTTYLKEQANSEQAGLMQSGNSAASQYRDQGTQYYDQALSGQNAINQARLGISTGQINSIRGLIDNIKNGLQSSRVELGNGNALDSSAADAVGRIMQNYGVTQQNSINNDAAVKQQAQDVQQGQLNNTNDANMAALNQFKTSKLGEIMQNAIQQLSGLKSSAGLYGVDPNSLGTDAIQTNVVNNANTLLGSVDGDIRGRLASVTPTSIDQIARQAYGLANAGVAGSTVLGASPINIGTPAQPGATNYQLPIAIDPSKFKQTA